MSSVRHRSFMSVLHVISPTLLACILMLWPQAAFAHAVLLKSNPAANATVVSGALDMMLNFNSRVDGSRSTVKLTLADGSSKPLPLDKQTTPDTVSGHISNLSPGTYALEWQVLSVDGHITRGRVPFQVK